MAVLSADLLDLPVRELAARIAGGTLSAETFCQGFLARCAAREDVEAFVYLNPEQALAEARARDAAPAPAMLQGIPIAVKDVIDTADMPTGYGCAGYTGLWPKADAGCVALAREAGAVVLGKTVTTEFAGPAPRQTRNPWNGAHTPGGSSSGSAAAVAAGLAPLGFGTQTAGSVIRPGSYCGAVAYKPSFGLITRSGVSPLADSLDTIGLFARRVEDVAWFAAALTGRMALAASLIRGVPHIGLYDEAGWAELSAENQIALRRAAAALADAGAKLSALPRLACHDRALDAQQALMDWEVPRALAYERIKLFGRLSPVTQAFISRPQPRPAEYDAAMADAAAARAALAQKTAGLDGWIAPAAPGIAPQGLGSTGDPIFNRLWTVLHVPCLSVPCIRHVGLPVGVQVIARDDATALGLAQFLETALQGAE
jgi:amidase